MEIWKEIAGYEGLYQISNFGNIKSSDRIVDKINNSKALLKGKILKPIKSKMGYNFVTLYINKKSKQYYVHRLVASAFLSNIENKKTVNHINAIKSDNRVENLEWNSQSENNKHSYDNNLNNAKGKNNGNVKLTEKQVLEIRSCNDSQINIAKAYNIDKSVISRIKSRKLWSNL